MTDSAMAPVADDTLAAIKPSDLPAPPEAAIQVMRACSRPDISSAELSRLVGSDPVLAAEILRVVNSPYFGLGQEIKSIVRAVTVLGVRALRNLALCLAVRDAVAPDAIPGFDMTAFWEDALLRAVAARELGRHLALDSDECFTAGLLQDFGLLVQIYVCPQRAQQWPLLRSQLPDCRLLLEQEFFGITHDQVLLMLSQAWSLPTGLAHALGAHHREMAQQDAAPGGGLQQVLYCSDWLSAVFFVRDKGVALNRCREILQQGLGLSFSEVSAGIAVVAAQVGEAAQALGLRIQQHYDHEQVLNEANLCLARENRDYQELTWLLEKTLKERDQLAAELNQELELAREIQQSLLPAPRDAYPLCGMNVPAKRLSGDFYDFFDLPDGRIYFNLGDVSGKGINAALLMAKTSSLFRCLGKQIQDPALLLAQINEELCETSVRGMFVTMVAGIYDPATQGVQLVSAGHMPVLLLRVDGEVETIAAQAPPLGIVATCQYSTLDIDLGSACLCLYSDGVTEGYIGENKELGMAGLIKLLHGLRHEAPPRIMEFIVSYLMNSTPRLRDDLTMVFLKGHNGPG